MCSDVSYRVYIFRVYFDEVLREGDMTLAAKLVPVLLERSILLINIPNYATTIHE